MAKISVFIFLQKIILKYYFKDLNEKITFLPQSMERILLQKHLKYIGIKTR